MTTIYARHKRYTYCERGWVDDMRVMAQRKGAMQLGEAIRRVRASVGQMELAKRMNDPVVDQSRISKWERGIGHPSLDQIRAIEDALGVRRGSVLRLAGYVEDEGSTLDTITADRALDEDAVEVMHRIYVRLSSAG